MHDAAAKTTKIKNICFIFFVLMIKKLGVRFCFDDFYSVVPETYWHDSITPGSCCVYGPL